MAEQIEAGLGREALRATVANGPQSFVRAYNSVAEEGLALSVDFTEAAVDPLFRELHTAALAGDLPGVRQALDAIQERQSPPEDLEVEGYLLYNSGYILLGQGELALAEEAFTTLNGFFPEIASVYVGLGDVYVQMGETASAIENYQQAMALEARFGWLAVVIDELESERAASLKEE
jgi:tetratricopeptide (TPR) repeat protein